MAAKLAAEHDSLWSTLGSVDGKRFALTTNETRDGAKALLAALSLTPGALSPGAPRQLGNDPSDILDAYLERNHGDAYLRARHEPDRSPHTVDDLLSPLEAEAIRLLKEEPGRAANLLSDALKIYLEEHDKGSQPKFVADTRRCINFVVTSVGDFPLPYYQREHAKIVRDVLMKSGNRTTTARRRLNTIKAVFNKGLREFDLRSHGNPFEKLQIAKEEQDSEVREAFTADELKTIAKACLSKNDDIRHIVALQADTGARLGEIVGLRISDINLNHEIPHILIRPHVALGRTLKNDNSERELPLVGQSLWGAQKALQAAQEGSEDTGWLFPRYAKDGKVSGTTASATINKWLSKSLKINKTSHSFRHSMRDRLRHAQVPEEIQNLIGGWGSRSAGQGYGQGYLLKQLQAHLTKIL